MKNIHLKNSFVWAGNVPEDIAEQLEYIEGRAIEHGRQIPGQAAAAAAGEGRRRPLAGRYYGSNGAGG